MTKGPKRSKTMDSRILPLFLLLFITVSVSGVQDEKVSCRNQAICALMASSVNFTCSYSNINITTGFWFNLKDKAKWRHEEHPEDLTLDSDYAGRVRYMKMTEFSLTLTITDLRERDSGEYHLMFITDKGEKYQSSAGVTLTVTDLQVTLDSTGHSLFCHTSCRVTSVPQRYYWYKNGRYLERYTDNMETFSLTNAEEGSYSCSVHGYNDILSLPLCFGRNCWNVTYTDTRVCALEGSSVEFSGSYSHPSDRSVNEVFWHYVQPNKAFQDLKQERQFTNRVKNVIKNRNSTLKMNQLTEKDFGEYRLRFISNNEGFSGKPGVVLNVTDLQVRVSHSAVASEGQTTVMLSCITSCTLSKNPTYKWYKNRQSVTNKLTKHNKIYLTSSGDTGNYSCAVRGREDLRSPEQTVTLSGADSCSGCLVEGNTIPIIVGITVFLALIIIVGALWMWRRRSKSVHSDSHSKGTDPQSGQQDDLHNSSIQFPNRTQGSSPSTHGIVPQDSVQHAEQDEVHYSSIQFPNCTQGLSPSTSGIVPQDTVQYAEVNIRRSTAAT